MDFYALLDQVVALLQERGRLSYGALTYQFKLDDKQLAALKDDLLFAHAEVRDEDGRGLVWAGAAPVSGSPPQEESSKFQVPGSQSGLRTADPGRWTPPHLAERIRAERVWSGMHGLQSREVIAVCT